jgi:hypothetical protein
MFQSVGTRLHVGFAHRVWLDPNGASFYGAWPKRRSRDRYRDSKQINHSRGTVRPAKTSNAHRRAGAEPKQIERFELTERTIRTGGGTQGVCLHGYREIGFQSTVEDSRKSIAWCHPFFLRPARRRAE